MIVSMHYICGSYRRGEVDYYNISRPSTTNVVASQSCKRVSIINCDGFVWMVLRGVECENTDRGKVIEG